ncbi:MAG: ABC transporter ATP-binding protein/permease [Burkholderiaceae bacterium]|nr:ABC transporter ATP-binding protein/permease [Burkholderiaceae bacterium]
MSTLLPQSVQQWRAQQGLKWAAFTEFLRRAWALTLPYFVSDQKWRARGMLVGIVVLNLGAVYMLVLINEWNRVFYDALQNRDADVFWRELKRFLLLAFGFVIIAVYRFYLTQLLEMHWRKWLTDFYAKRWLSHHAFYRLELLRFAKGSGDNTATDNPDQRIHEDLNLFTSYTVSLTMGLLNAVVTLVSFVGILWSLSGGFSFYMFGTAVTIPGFMVWMALLYCTVGSVLTHYIGRPLIGLNFRQQRVEADYRHHLVRLREYSESVAMDKGEMVEQSRLDRRFGAVLSNYLQLLLAQKRLTWFTVGFGQLAVVFPFVVAAPRFFSGAIQLGQLMQISSAFGRVQDSLSWFVDSYDSLARWRATTDRLTMFEDAMQAVTQDTAQHHDVGQDHVLVAKALQLKLPNHELLGTALDLNIAPGQAWCVQGASGSGKSTLLRAIAGVWPWWSGSLVQPPAFTQQSMFLPQRSYFPNGPLREAVAYPQMSDGFEDATLQRALMLAGLPELASQLSQEANWGQKLSGGEQQRLAIARVFLKKPMWLFLDEATSALDEATEAVVYQALLDDVLTRGGAVVSVAHRSSVAKLHSHQWAMPTQA